VEQVEGRNGTLRRLTGASKTLFNRYHFAVNRDAAFIGYSK
jgi:hypothetical protein